MSLSIQPTQALKVFLQKAPIAQRALGNFVSLSEGTMGNQHLRFLQHAGAVWAPKALVHRSLPELAELSFLEFVETAFFYYSMPFFANKVFKNTLSKLAPKAVNPKLLTQTFAQLSKNPTAFKAAIPVKAAIILASMGTIVGEYSLSFVKNLITEKAFRLNKFSDVVALTHTKDQKKLNPNVNSPVAQKAYRRLAQCGAIALGMIGSAALLARFGRSSPLLQKLSQGIVKTFDFEMKHGKFDLSRPQLWGVIWFGVASYLDAARDKLEFKEIFSRVACVVAPYLSVGKELLEKLNIKYFGNKYPHILNADKSGAKTIETLVEQSLSQATKQLTQQGKTVTQNAVLNQANKIFQPLLKSKNQIFTYPLLSGVGVIGLLTSAINNYWTQKRYERAITEDSKTQKWHQRAAYNRSLLPDKILGYQYNFSGQHPNQFQPNIKFH